MINPGDKVVCIATSTPCCDRPWDTATFPAPIIGRYYTVGMTGDGRCQTCGTRVPCLIPDTLGNPLYAWPQPNFRKVEAGDADIFRLADVPVPVPA